MRFLLAPLVILLGLAMMRYTVPITHFTGKIDWAEQYFRGGIGAGTFTLYRVVGLAFVILGVMWLFGLLGWLGSALSVVFPKGINNSAGQ